MAAQFIVGGAWNDTGADQQLVIEADDVGQAEQIANIRGLLVCAVRPVESPTPPIVPAAQKKDSRCSPAHLLLLSKFLKGDSPQRYLNADFWEVALNERPTEAISRFIAEGMLEPAELPEQLSYKFKVSDLRSMLKGIGLKLSGRKEELIRRLIDNDGKAMSEVTKDTELYRCTAAGMQVVARYLDAEKAKKDAVEREVLNLLAAEEYAKAVHVVVQFRAAQVFSGALGFDWKDYDGTSDGVSLKAAFNTTPAILQALMTLG